MPHRAASPAASENEFDITNALFQNDSDSDNDTSLKQTKRPQKAAPPQALDFLGGDIDDDEDDEAFIAGQQASANRKASNLKGRTVKKGGGFQAMGLNAHLLKAITRKGFSVPTPIQRKTIPVIMDGQDVVGMARTGSGKTAAFVIPMIEKLKSHSTKVGARGLVLSPSRELALQTLKVVKELGKGTDLKSVLLVGGDSLEEQFSLMAGNPDIVIATPGRFLHLKVEMNLDLSSIRYVVFDEADRLFEMGFADQLTEILYGLPANRQTLLFSATLPKSLVEFARAGLQEPTLIRLDTESKISPDLENAFFSVKSSEKEGALLHILHEVIKMPTGPTEAAQRQKEQGDGKNFKNFKKRKRGDDKAINFKESPTKYSTIVFAATKHHVDYLYSLLREAGFAVSYAYGSLDQTARKIQVQNFRTGLSNILVVTDVAARGIDIPILANVINYDFPSQPKIFVHRVGRTARAGRKGWSYSLVRDADAPYMLDLQLFLGRRLVVGREHGDQVNFAEDVVVGSLPRDGLSTSCEWVTKVLENEADIYGQRTIAGKGEKLYMRTRNSASLESAKRAKQVVSSDNWTAVHPLFNDQESQMEVEREKMLARIAEPGWFDLEESVKRTIHWINEAGKAGCKFIAFPELWIPGYPYWAWKVNYQESLPLLKKYRENSLPSDSEEMRRIREAARANKIFVSLGYSELDLASLYTTQVLISPTGDILNHRRKIRATHVERLVFGDGTGDTTESVIQTEIGRVGHLNCWENMNPFMKAYAASLGEQVHVAAWPLYPGKETLKYPDPFTNVAEANADLVTPAYAIETGTFTLAPWQSITAEGIKLNTPPGKELEDPHIYNGHGRIFGPDGQNLVPHPDKDFQGLLIVDIDLDECHLSKSLADFGGHYMRPDLIRLLVDTNRKDLVVHEDRVNGGVAYTRTVDRVGLSTPLEAATPNGEQEE